jgi:AcrR family transcriptional regulator
VSPRTQVERREATTAALLDAARELFAQDGYAATSLDAVVARAGVTKGALYHHYDGKRELFRAVLHREMERLAEGLAEVFARKRDPWDGVQAGCRAFLEAALDPELQRLLLIDGPGALGFTAVREAEAPTLTLLQEGLRRAMDAGHLDTRPVEPLAALLFGALCEAALTIARADDQRAAQRAMSAELRRLFDGLA